MYWKRKYIQWTKCTKFLKYIKKWPNIRCKNMHICSSKVSNKYPILLQCNMNESNQKHNISEKAWEWDYTHFIFYKVLQKKYIRGRIFLRQTAIIFIKPRHDMEKNIAHKFCSTSNAFSSLALLLSCVYGCYGNLFRMSGQFFPF